MLTKLMSRALWTVLIGATMVGYTSAMLQLAGLPA